MVDCLVTTAGGIEEDIIKCFASTYNGDFSLNGSELRQKAISRIGNLLIPNDNYCSFENFLMPILDHMLKEQNTNNVNWTPSKMIEYMGHEINHEQSVYYWASKNNIPVFCPPITDGSIGDLIFFHSLQNPGLRIDIAEDIKKINTLAINSLNTGCLILGGGIVKHHILNANAMRSGADYVVSINTAMEYDGSDSGANLDEAVSWAKIRPNAQAVKVFGDASILFPLLVARTFAMQDLTKLQNL
jgi:deoxyhypusine synthase